MDLKVVRKFEDDGRRIIDHRIDNGGHNGGLNQGVLGYVGGFYQNKRNALNRDVISGISKGKRIQISETTLKDAKRFLGFVSNKPRIIRDVTLQNLLKRFKYCQRHKDDKFSNCIFTDESSIQLFENKALVWWQPSFEDRPGLLVKPIKGKIMVWGRISRKKKTELVIIRTDQDETLDRFSYFDILNDHCIEQMNASYGKGHWCLVQGNARPRIASLQTDWLKEKKIRLLEHPPYSPDLNPIEKVWNFIKQQLYTKPFANLDELENIIKSVWDSIDFDYINKLIDNHIKTIELVYNSDGAYLWFFVAKNTNFHGLYLIYLLYDKLYGCRIIM